jgi:hypothetical protein
VRLGSGQESREPDDEQPVEIVIDRVEAGTRQ